MRKSAPPSLKVLWPDGALVGKVVTPGDTYFGYDLQWLSNGYNLSPLKVPFTETVYRGRDPNFDRLPGFLCDCIPDQWGRRIMAGNFNAENIKVTALNMLAWVGSRGIGALSFEPAIANGEENGCWANVTPLLLAREAQAVLRKPTPESFEFLKKAGTAGGAFPKATIALMPDNTVMFGGNVARAAVDIPEAKLGILKLDCEDLPGRPSTDGRMEFAYLEMSRAAGVRTTKCQLLPDDEGERLRQHLFVERFDVVPGAAERLHLVTLAGLLETYSLTYSDLLSATLRLTQDRAELTEAVRRMLFNIRAGNSDDHGKNHSFLFDARTKQWTLSPAYDLTLNYSENRSFNGLSQQSFGSSPRIKAVREVAAEYGVREDEFNAIDKEVTAAVAAWETFATKAGIPEKDFLRAKQRHEQVIDSLAAHGEPRVENKRMRLF